MNKVAESQNKSNSLRSLREMRNLVSEFRNSSDYKNVKIAIRITLLLFFVPFVMEGALGVIEHRRESASQKGVAEASYTNFASARSSISEQEARIREGLDTEVQQGSKLFDSDIQTSSIADTPQSQSHFSENISAFLNSGFDSKILGQVESFSIMLAAVLFVLGAKDRKRQEHAQLWRMIDGAQGSETSGARKQAIEQLHNDGADITGLDADNADLRNVKLSGADLRNANFRRADLRGADLSGATLTGANLTNARLEGADLQEANLRGAMLKGVQMGKYKPIDAKGKEKSNFRKTNISGCDFSRANLSDTEILDTIIEYSVCSDSGKAKLEKANFRHSCLHNAVFGTDIEFKYILWEEAKLGGINLIHNPSARKKDDSSDNRETLIDRIMSCESLRNAYFERKVCEVVNSSGKYELQLDKEYSESPNKTCTQEVREQLIDTLNKSIYNGINCDQPSSNIANLLQLLLLENVIEVFNDEEKKGSLTVEMLKSLGIIEERSSSLPKEVVSNIENSKRNVAETYRILKQIDEGRKKKS